MSTARWPLTLLFIGLAAALPLRAAGDAAAEFAQLKSLVGVWHKAGEDGQTFHIEFTETARGTVLLEHWLHQGRSHSITVYHLDGDALLATHYCPQGNQPRLRSTQAAAPDRVDFVFQDATGLSDPKHSHQHTLGFQFLTEDAVERHETYLQDGQSAPSSLKLVRQRR